MANGIPKPPGGRVKRVAPAPVQLPTGNQRLVITRVATTPDVVCSIVVMLGLAVVAFSGPGMDALLGLAAAAFAGGVAAFLRVRYAWIEEVDGRRRAMLGILVGLLLLAIVGASISLLSAIR